MAYTVFFKPLFDKIFALILLICSSPLTIPVTIILWFANNGKPFFVQKRPGKNEEIFSLIKFKTMNDKKDENGELLPDSVRLTWIGKFVRKTSLDEIPQMINVLKGNMSLIGPRPLLVQYLPLYNNEQKKRHLVKPGITGWAQVNGRNAIDWDKKFELDVWYVNNISFGLDSKIFLKTIINIVSSSGISQEGEATMSTFKGSK
jgi:undecaprenyl phosphate N,N'-diacetylbacillosamine 1-phosphate transferase